MHAHHMHYTALPKLLACRFLVFGTALVLLWCAQQPCCWGGMKRGRLTSCRLSSRHSMHSSLTARTAMVMIITKKQVQKGLEGISTMYTRAAAVLQMHDARFGNACATAAVA